MGDAVKRWAPRASAQMIRAGGAVLIALLFLKSFLDLSGYGWFEPNPFLSGHGLFVMSLMNRAVILAALGLAASFAVFEMVALAQMRAVPEAVAPEAEATLAVGAPAAAIDLETYSAFVHEHVNESFYAGMLKALQASMAALGYETVRIVDGDASALPEDVFVVLAGAVMRARIKQLYPRLDEFGLEHEVERASDDGYGAALLQSILNALAELDLYVSVKEESICQPN